MGIYETNIKAYYKAKKEAEKAGIDTSTWPELDDTIAEELIREFDTEQYYMFKSKAEFMGLDTSKWVDPTKPTKKFKCPIDYEGCTKFCGSYGCGG